MATIYRTKAGETLDWICWQYYVKEVNLGAAAMNTDPRLLENQSILDSGFLLNEQSDNSMSGAVELVLKANPGLAGHPLELPAGLEIVLPEFNQELTVSNKVKLWD